jgi:hypothetical protein
LRDEARGNALVERCCDGGAVYSPGGRRHEAAVQRSVQCSVGQRSHEAAGGSLRVRSCDEASQGDHERGRARRSGLHRKKQRCFVAPRKVRGSALAYDVVR